MSSPRSTSSTAWQDETTTPPSSPPPLQPTTFDLKQDQENRAPHIDGSSVANAFSLLGKRKTHHDHTEHEAQQARKRAAMTLTRSSKPQEKTQMQLSLGQKIEKKCKECGMLYILSSAEDRQLHDRYHKRSLDGYDVGKQLLLLSSERHSAFNPTIKRHIAAKERICIVRRGDAAWKRRHAREVLDIITTSLGACEISDEELWSRRRPDKEHGRYEMYMLLVEGKCVAAALVEASISGAKLVLDTPTSWTRLDGKGSSLDQLRKRREACETENSATLRLSTTTCTARVGISRIWTAPNYRRQALAQVILHEISADLKPSVDSPKVRHIDAIAFSQPTTAGTKLARSFFRRQSGWMVY